MQKSPDRSESRPEKDRALTDEAIEWFARLRSSRSTPEERLEFERWKRRSPAHELAWRELCSVWNDPELLNALGSASRHYAGNRATKSIVPRYWRQAAVLGLLCLGALLFAPDWIQLLRADHRTSAGEQRTVQLADGSAVTLNTSTAVIHDWDENVRRTRLLIGDAFFAVQPERRRPFIVETDEVVARAVGTKFLVAKRRGTVQVTVVEGAVQVSPRLSETNSIPVSSGQQVTISPDGVATLSTPDLNAATAWMRRRLIFDGAPLSDVAAEISRYHSGGIVVVGSSARRLLVTGVYDLTDTQAILHALAQTLPIHRIDLTSHLVILY